MSLYSFYDEKTGLFNGTHLLTTDHIHVAPNTPRGHVAIPGHHDHLRKRVDLATGEIVDHPIP